MDEGDGGDDDDGDVDCDDVNDGDDGDDDGSGATDDLGNSADIKDDERLFFIELLCWRVPLLFEASSAIKMLLVVTTDP